MFNEMLERTGVYLNIKFVMIKRSVVLISNNISKRMLAVVKNFSN